MFLKISLQLQVRESCFPAWMMNVLVCGSLLLAVIGSIMQHISISSLCFPHEVRGVKFSMCVDSRV